MYDEDVIDTTADTSTSNTSTSEYAEFRAWKDSRIREAALAQGRSEASAEAQAAEAAADAAALQTLADKGLSLKDVFGHTATPKGRNEAVLLHRSSFARQSGVYPRLRRLAAKAGLLVQ